MLLGLTIWLLPSLYGVAAAEEAAPAVREIERSACRSPDREMLRRARPWIVDLPQSPPDPDGLVALPYFAWGDNRRGNELVATVSTYDRGTPKERWGYWNLFELLHVWMLYRDRLTPKAEANIRSAFKHALRPGGRIDRYWLRAEGGNINHGLSCMALSLVGGEQFDVPAAAERGRRKLDRFAECWSRVGSFSEYNSPTYSAVDVLALATVRQHARDVASARKARILEERFWIEASARYHPATGTLTGPFSRSYYWDDAGGASDMHYAFHRVLGDSVPLMFDLTARHYRMDHRLSWAGRSAVATYACPEYVRHRMLDPMKHTMLRATTVPVGGHVALASYMGGNISLGTAGQRFEPHHQRTDLVARWSRRRPVERFGDLRALTARQYGPGDPEKSRGRHFCLQDDGRVLMLAVLPKVKEPCTARRLGVRLLVTLEEDLDEIRVGRRTVETLPHTANVGEPIVLRDGPVYVALRPLPGTDHGTDRAVRLSVVHKQESRLLEIALANYEGEPRTFSPEEFDATYHGFALEIAEAKDHASFDAFCRSVAAWDISAKLDTDGICSTAWTSAGHSPLRLRTDIPNRRIVEPTVNRRAIEEPMLDGPLVRQDMTGRIALSGATLTTAEGVPALLFSDPENHAYAAMNPTSHQSRFSLRTPQLTATIDSLGFGRVELLGLDPTTLNIDAVSLDGRLTLAPGPNGSPVELGRIEIVVNGRQLTGGQDRETTIYYDLSESIK